MRKVTKILAKVLSTIILLLIFLPISVTLFLSINTVQNYIAGKASTFASEFLGTKVSVGYINIDLFSRVHVRDFYVEDYESDTLLYVNEAKARFAGFNIPVSGLRISDASVKSGVFNLREMKSGELNVRPIVQKLTKSGGKSNFKMYIESIDAEDVEFCYRRLQPRNPEYGVDYYHMHVRDIAATVQDFYVIGNRVGGKIHNLSAVERSGFRLDNFGCELILGRGMIELLNLTAITPKSWVYLPYITIDGHGSWDYYKEYIDEVRMEAKVERTIISTDDIGYFAPAMREWNTTISEVEASFGGVVSDFEGVLKHAVIGDGSSLAGSFKMVGLPDWKSTRYDIVLDDVYIRSADAAQIMNNVVKTPLPSKVMDIVQRVEWLDMDARFGGRIDNFDVDLDANSAVGAVMTDLAIKRSRDGYKLDGDLSTENVDLGRLLGQAKLHGVDAHVVANLMVSKEGLFGSVDGDIVNLGIGSNVYSGVGVKANIDGSEYAVNVVSSDSNFSFDIDEQSTFKLADDQLACNILFNNVRADLHALGINKRDSVSLLTIDQIFVQASGASVEELNGELSISGVEYKYPGDVLETDLITISLEEQYGSKTVVLDSEFLSGGYLSDMSYKQTLAFARHALKTYLPLMYDGSSHFDAPTSSLGISMFLQTGSSNERVEALLKTIDSKLIIAPSTQMIFTYRPETDKMTMTLKSEVLEYAGIMMENAEVDINNVSEDELSLWVRSSAIASGSTDIMPNFMISGGTRRNKMNMLAEFQDSVEGRYGRLNLNALFERDTALGRRVVYVDSISSSYSTPNQRWVARSRGIDVASSRITIHDLNIIGNDIHTGSNTQRLKANGVLSRSREDSIRVDLTNFDLSPLSALVKRWGYDVSARSNGHISVRSALQGQAVDARLQLDDIAVNDHKTNPQLITSRWDFAEDRAYVLVNDTHRQDTVIQGIYQPKSKQYQARAKMDNIPLSLISPFLVGILSDIEGKADVDVSVTGEGRKALLSGSADVDSLAVVVDYTQVRYISPGGRVNVRDNHIITENIPVSDEEGNSGQFSMDIDLNDLSNIKYGIDIGVKDILVLDTDENDNDLFYGHVYASGDATFRGDKLTMKIDIDATSGNNSTFYMPLSGKENASYAEFVRFREPEPEQQDTMSYRSKRRKANERKRQAASAISSILDIEMNMNVLPNTEIQLVFDPTVGDVIKARGSGELTLHFVPKTGLMNMSGLYTITEGTYLFTLQNIINKKFVVTPGSTIAWSGDPMNAMLNIETIYSTKASLKPLLGNSMRGVETTGTVPVDCYIYLKDNLMSPSVTFDVKVEQVDSEIQTVVKSALNDQQAIATQLFWLLAAGTFSAEDTGAMGASISATTGFEMLSNQLSNWLSGDNYNIVLRYRPRTDTSGDEVDLGLSTSLLDDRLIIEVEGGYMADASAQASENVSNFVGEAYVTWLIDPDGSTRFRGFTQTIDRYGENQGMQEAGLGIYFSESFNTFKELGQSLKERFINPESAKRRAEKRAQKQQKREMKSKKGETIAQETLPVVREVVAREESLCD